MIIRSTNQHLLAVLPTRYLRQLTIQKYRKLGWKYFVTFLDVNGFGVQAFPRAEWQDENSPVSIR